MFAEMDDDEYMTEAEAAKYYSYAGIQQHGSQELRNIAEIILGGFYPGGRPINKERESA